MVSSFVPGSASRRGTVAIPRQIINIFFAEADVELVLAFPVYLAGRVSGFSNGGLKRKSLPSTSSIPMEVTEGFKSTSNTANSFSAMFPHASYIRELMQSLYWSTGIVHRSRNDQRADVIPKREHRRQWTDWVRWDFANTLRWIYFLPTRQQDS